LACNGAYKSILSLVADGRKLHRSIECTQFSLCSGRIGTYPLSMRSTALLQPILPGRQGSNWSPRYSMLASGDVLRNVQLREGETIIAP
jgi:hypothetical protein